MQLKEKMGLYYWEFELLRKHKTISHGSFLKLGGVSQGVFSSLNVSLDVGDDPSSVKVNCDKIKQVLNLSGLCIGKQEHGVKIVEVNENSSLFCGDAFITQTKGVGLLIKHADCQAALFYDPALSIIAAVHAGWRGSVQKIYTQVINYLKIKLNVDPKNLLVCISPSLGPEKAEFVNFRNELPEPFWSFQIKPNYFDFWSISEQELLEAGVREENIEIAKVCTVSNEEYFSYRREKKTGRLASVIALC